MKTFNSSPIALIDSGIGGLSLLKELVKKYPNENYIYLADNLNMPYGNKSKRWLVLRLNDLINDLYDKFNVKLVILACNTASTTYLQQLNISSPVKVIGLDLNSCVTSDYNILCTRLTSKNCSNLNTLPCSKLASFIEDNIFDKQAINRYIKRVVNKLTINEQNLILGCTHYELVASEFKMLLPNKNIILPCKEFVDNLKLDIPNKTSQIGDILMLSTLSTKSYIDKLWKIYKS